MTTRVEEIEGRLEAVRKNQGDGLKLSAALDVFDYHAVEDIAYLLAEVKRLEGERDDALRTAKRAADYIGHKAWMAHIGDQRVIEAARKLGGE